MFIDQINSIVWVCRIELIVIIISTTFLTRRTIQIQIFTPLKMISNLVNNCKQWIWWEFIYEDHLQFVQSLYYNINSALNYQITRVGCEKPNEQHFVMAQVRAFLGRNKCNLLQFKVISLFWSFFLQESSEKYHGVDRDLLLFLFQ